MTPNPFPSPFAANYTALPLASIPLSDAQIEQAIAWSQVATHESQQWRLYHQGLALLGLEQWLTDRAPALTLQFQNCSLLHPIYANLLDGICLLTVGDIQLCLLATGSLTDRLISIPRATLDLTGWTPHLYVLAEVNEDQGWVEIQGGLPGDRLQPPNTPSLSPQSDWTYALPRYWFDASPEDLLLWFNCWQPPALTPIPVSVTQPTALNSDDLIALAPQLLMPDQDWWQVLTWHQAIALLTQPQLADALAQALDTQRHSTTPLSPQSAAFSPPAPTQTLAAINVGLWLQGQLDDLAQTIGWVLLPPLAADWRSNSSDLMQMLQDLQQQGMEIPPDFGSASRDLSITQVDLRLYALNWSLPATDTAPDQPRWSLLFILGPQPDTPLKAAVRLRVRDATHPLHEQILHPDDTQPYCYTQVIGTWDEQFWVAIAPADAPPDTEIELTPFCFDPKEGLRI